MDTENMEYRARFNTGHPGSICSVSQAGLPEALERVMRVSRKINAGDTSHHFILSKSRDGMSGVGKRMSESRGASRATELLANLLRRI